MMEFVDCSVDFSLYCTIQIEVISFYVCYLISRDSLENVMKQSIMNQPIFISNITHTHTHTHTHIREHTYDTQTYYIQY